MERRKLGELEISPIIFGAWAIGGWMWGGPGSDEADAISAIHSAIDNGVNVIDTAPVYGMGTSERIVAKAIKGKRSSVVIATKCGMRWDSELGSNPWESQDNEGRKIIIRSNSDPKSIIEECEQSLRRLEINEIDLYQIHRPDTDTPPEASMEAMLRLKEQGKIRAIGVSNYDVEWMKRAETVAKIDSLQPPYSILRRNIEKEIIPHCIKNKIGIICYSPLERGLLTGSVAKDKKFPDSDHRSRHPYFTPENREKVRKILEGIRPICERHRAGYSQLFINWTVQQPGITAAIVGARNAEQARHNAGALQFRLSKDEISEMNQIVSEEWE